MTTALDGKVALVTGAGGGIGLATAEAFAEAGASVVLADRDEETIGKAAEGLRTAGHNTIGVTCDVTDAAQVEAMIERTVSTYGRLDAAFNNAGVNSEAAAFLDTSDDEFERVMNVNLRGVWNCMKGELRQMMAQGSGAIVNCSSIGGLKGSRGRSAYSASNHAMIGLTRSVLFSTMPPRASASTRSAREWSTRRWQPSSRRITIRKSSGRWWRKDPSDASVSRKKSPLPWYGFAAWPRASCWVMQ